MQTYFQYQTTYNGRLPEAKKYFKTDHSLLYVKEQKLQYYAGAVHRCECENMMD